jgi:glycosyltransferase involved in cell wall biosynthesis
MTNTSIVSVIVPIYNCALNIQETLLILNSQDYDGEIEIIVVDNNSTDGSDEIVKQVEGIRLVYEREIQNAAATRNKGIEVATGEIVAFIDGDCIPKHDWLQQAVDAISHTGADRVGGKIEVGPITPENSIYELLDALFCFNQENTVKNLCSCMTGNFIVKRKVFDQIGVFNQDYFEMEDIEFGLRAAKANISIVYAKDCIVTHPPRKNIQEMWQKSKRNGKGTFTLCQKNPQWSGKFGWKHPLRCIKIMLTPRTPYWRILPFARRDISLPRRINIYLGSWMIINIGEAHGYFEAWIKFIMQKQFC